MSDENPGGTPPTEPPSGDQEPGQEPGGQQDPVPYDRFQQVIQERNDMRGRLETLEKAQKDADAEAAKEQGKWKELYEESLPQTEALERYETAVKAMLEGRLEQVPENLRGLVPEGTPLEQLTWLEKAAAAGMFEPEPGPRSPGVPPGGPRQPPAPTITSAQMGDPEWVREHAAEIRQAAKEGRLER